MNLTPLILAQVGAGMETLILVGAMILIGIIIIMVVGALLFFLPAAVLAGVVWFLTGNELYTGLAFLAVALLSLTRRK
jgi:membrane protein implicated in regulation of membrane protease activity